MQTLIDNPRVPVPATSMIGRDAELARLHHLLLRPDVRLVTVLGPGGVGKTRLALQLAQDIAGDIPDVRFVPLASVTAREDILPAIGRVVGIRAGETRTPLEEIAAAIAGEDEMLLLLDNVEQLAEHLTILPPLLAACPNLTILATSRVVLRLSVEHVFALDPLPVNSGDHNELSQATALFVDRARTVRPGLELTPETVAAIDDICRIIDGLPLAIELAAARSRLLAPLELRDRLTGSLEMLKGGPRDAPERHRTLRATLEWSHSLLTPDERVLFRRLAIAPNGLPYDAVDPICNAGGDLDDLVDDLLAALVDHSLVRIDHRPETGPRVRMLQTVREFAGEQLAASGEAEVVRRAHALWYAQMVTGTSEAIWGTGRSEMRVWTLRNLPDVSTFPAVLHYLVDHGDEALAAAMTTQLISFWNELGHLREARFWTGRVLPFIDLAPRDVQASYWFKAAGVRHAAGDIAEALTFASRGLSIQEELGDPRLIANGQNLVGNLYGSLGNVEMSEHYHRLAIARFEAVGNTLGAAISKSQLADHFTVQGTYDRAEQLLDEAEPVIARERAEALPLFKGSRAILYLLSGRLDDAGAYMEQSLAYHAPPPHRRPDMLSLILMYAAELAGFRNAPEEGARLLAMSNSILERIDLHITDRSQGDVDRIEAMLRDQLPPDRFEVLTAEGQALSIPAAIELATRVARIRGDSPVTPDTGVEDIAGLTAREREVLALLVAGKSNAEIADELFISHRTVTTHLTRLYAKLDVTSRTGAMSEAIRRGLIREM